ncbi:hypothetical protein IV203_028555 [Nitzschia inconspicua]|uniref:Uncharacterized protein n=1 Tax=Nitzschia inconspicua TaxID=303405 RepID=A0A9K3LNU4_9STRA|nr:hypothetical protein IV203_028555 [Nitzschia inconspicua]
MIWRLVSRLHSLLEYVAQSVLSVMIYFALAIALAYYMGWLERWIWFVLEKEARKILNGAKVTIGSFQIDWSQLLQGKITAHASNVVIHTPKRNEWQWESPLIARVGKASVECNAPICIFHDVFLRRELPIEAYTVIVTDVQVFVERRDSVINVYLLNPTLIVPPPPERMEIDFDSSIPPTNNTEERMFDASCDFSDAVSTQGIDSNCDNNNNDNNSSSTTTDPSDEKAKKLVNEMLHAVQDLGRAATRGQLPGAIKQQGLGLVDRLKGFREQDNNNLEEGIRVMQQVGKVAVQSLQQAPKLILPQPDDTKQGKPVFCRVGRIVINEMRIFTKDSWIKPDDGTPTTRSNVSGVVTSTQSTSKTPPRPTKGSVGTPPAVSVSNNKIGSWNKPIYIQCLIIRASELSPPMSSKDENDLPAIYQKVDRVAEIVWRRLLAEMAKSNTGKLFSTAMGEVLSVMITNRQSGNATTTIGAGSSLGKPTTTAAAATSTSSIKATNKEQ